MKLKNKGFTLVEVLVALVLVVVALIFLGNLTGCTDDDQAKEVARQKRIEAREQQETQAREEHNQQEQTTRDNEAAAVSEQQAKEEEKPAEPKTETVITYHFTSTTERNLINCEHEGEITACGVNYKDCGSKGEDDYACQTGVHEWSTSREQLVKDDN